VTGVEARGSEAGLGGPTRCSSKPNGVVDASGIHGHRIEKTAWLQLDILDATGQPPTYPK
jgi:hypothetical protein